MKQSTKFFALLICLCMALTMLFPAPAKAAGEDEAFEAWLTEEWVETMETDYLNMHFNVRDYRAYGIEKPEVTLGTINKEDYALGVQDNQDTIDELKGFNYDALSRENQQTYDVLMFYLEQMVILNQYPQFEELFNPYNGYLTNLVTNFTEFVFYEKEDFEDYLTLIADYPRFIDEMWAFTKDQAAEGYFMPDATLDEALTEISEFVAKGTENPLIVIFDENVDAFPGLTDEEKASFKTRNSDLVLHQVLPAYEKAAENLETLRGSRQNDKGICGYPGGEEYYAALAKYEASADMTVQEMYDYCEASIDNVLQYYRKAYMKNRDFQAPATVPFSTAEEILDYLSSHLEDFPAGPTVNYTAKYLDKSIENPSVVAYYLTPPLDDISENAIKINGSSVQDDINDLYMTLSHEGFPGHLYQFTWYYNTNPHPIRTAISVMGYQEGWAMYVENLMIRKSGLDEMSYVDAEANTYYGYVYNALMEFGINGLGWDLKEFGEFMNGDGGGYTAAELKEIYDQMRSMPGTMISYGFGDAYFMNLRAMAQKAMGQYFDEVGFHEVLLEGGPRQFEMLQTDVENYIARQGYKVPSSYAAYEIEAYGVPVVEQGTPVPEEESEISITYGEDSDYEFPEDPEDPFGIIDQLDGDGGETADMLKRIGKALLIGGIIFLVVVIGVVVLIVVLVKRSGKRRREEEMRRIQWMNQQNFYNQPQGQAMPYQQNPYQQGANQQPYPQGQYQKMPNQQNPYQQMPYQQNPYQQQPYQQGAYQQQPYQQAPYQQAPYQQAPYQQQVYQQVPAQPAPQADETAEDQNQQ